MSYLDPNAPVIARLFATDVAPNRRIEIDSNPSNRIRFYTSDITNSGWNYGYVEITDGTDFASLKMQPPNDNLVDVPFLALDYDGVGTDTATLYAEQIVFGNPTTAGLEIVSDRLQRPLPVWTNLALNGTWAAAGAPIQTPMYYVDPVGTVHIRGMGAGGAANPVGTLPVGARPSARIDLAMKSNNDAGTVSWVQIATNGQINVVGNFAAAVVGFTLACSFSNV